LIVILSTLIAHANTKFVEFSVNGIPTKNSFSTVGHGQRVELFKFKGVICSGLAYSNPSSPFAVLECKQGNVRYTQELSCAKNSVDREIKLTVDITDSKKINHLAAECL
jgi:hypothetical protein